MGYLGSFMTNAQSTTFSAAAWMMGAVVSFSLMAVAGREVSVSLDTIDLMLFRSLVGIIIVLIFGAMAGTLWQIRFRNVKLHVLRNVFHFAGQYLWFYAVALIPFAQLFALEFSFPIWVALAAPLLLGERLTKIRMTTAVVGFVGILVVARPGLVEINSGVMAAALCAIGFAGSVIYTKVLTRTESITCILFWLSVIQAVLGCIAVAVGGEMTFPSMAAMKWIVMISFAGLCAHYCVTRALELAPAIIVAPLDFIRLPLIACVGMMFYSESLDVFVVAGAIMIVGANYANLHWENRQRQSRNTKANRIDLTE